MIATKNNSIHVDSTVTGKVTRMSIDPSAFAHIMDSMTNLYSDAEYAVIREYSTNARDSHIEAGVEHPIDITLPSELAPFLTIRDYGVGLNEDDIENIYSMYGASTKRGTNDQVGMLGFGCKSALAYTSQFTLVGIKEGIRTVVSIARDDDGAGSMTTVEQSETDEDNGVEVRIPVKASNRMEQKAHDFFRFWEKGTVRINGEEPEYLTGLKVTDEILVCDNTEGQDYIVMGNVPYPTQFYRGFSSDDTSLVAFVKIGDVDFVPSREALKNDADSTKTTIQRVKDEYDENIDAAVERTIAEVNTFAEAFRLTYRWSNILGKRIKVKFKGRDIPDCLKVEDEATERFVVTNATSSKLSDHNRVKQVGANALINGIIFHGYDLTSFTPTHKKKLLMYCEENGVEASHFILMDKKLKTDWVEADKFHDWADVAVLKIPIVRTYANANRPKGSYDVYEAGSYVHGKPADEIDATKGICYVNTTTASKDTFRDVGYFFQQIGWKGTLVALASNRVDKFCRDFPKAKPAEKVVQAIFKGKSKKVRDDDYLIAAVRRDSQLKRFVEYYKLDGVADQDIIKYAALIDEKMSEAYTTVYTYFDADILRFAGLERPSQRTDYECPLDKYGLLRMGYSRPSAEDRKHTITYMNAIHAQSLIDAMRVGEEA